MLFQYLLVLLLVVVIVATKSRSKRLVSLHALTRVNFRDIPVVGHAYKFIGSNEDRMSTFDEFGRQAYRNEYGAVSFWFANYLCVLISDPVSAGVVFKTCLDKWPITLFARHLLGNGSVFGEEKIWRLRRKILAPMFAPKHYDNFAQVFVRNNKVLVEELAAVVGKGDFSMWKYFCAYALDSALDMTFGENVNAQRRLDHPFFTAFEDYFTNAAARICQPWLYSAAVYKLLPVAVRQRYNKKVIWEFIENLIIKKKMEISNKHLTKKTGSGDTETLNNQSETFLKLLIELSAREGGYTNDELREETLVLIVAATDTSATGACFATVLLAQHPEVQDRIYNEVRELLGDSERDLSIEDLAKLKYLNAVVNESLRLYPPVPVTIRYCTKDVELPSGLILPGGSAVLLNPWVFHRNPHYWGADADEFNPERFLNATPEQLTAYMPFSNGPRNCTGMRLATASLKLSLAEITRRYRIVPAASCGRAGRKPLRVSFDIMLKHVDDFKVRLENRR